MSIRGQKPKVKSGKPWTAAEDEIIKTYYPELGAQGTLKLLTDRTAQAIQTRAHNLKVGHRPRSTHRPLNAKEEKAIIVGEVEFMIHLVCGEDSEKAKRAIRVLRMTEELKPIEWWMEHREMRLGNWLEKFITGYEWKPIFLRRDDFLEGDGVFVEYGGVDL